MRDFARGPRSDLARNRFLLHPADFANFDLYQFMVLQRAIHRANDAIADAIFADLNDGFERMGESAQISALLTGQHPGVLAQTTHRGQLMKIVVLDGYTLNPGDQSWSALESLGECRFFDRTAAADVVDRAHDCEIVITNKVVLNRDTLERLPRLAYIGVTATGYNIVDVGAARDRGVIVTNVPVYSTRSVAQFTFALILELAHHVGRHAESVRRGDWARCPDFSYWTAQQVELEGKTLGVVGWGRIGRAVGELGRAFGMHVIAATRSPNAALEAGMRSVSVDDVFANSDIVSLHCPLTDQTRHIANRSRLAAMKRDAWLINTSRGPLVDEVALAEALNSGTIGAAAVDVLSVEPPPADHPLFTANNGIITPHMAWATVAARRRLMATTVDNVRAFLAGEPIHVVNP